MTIPSIQATTPGLPLAAQNTASAPSASATSAAARATQTAQTGTPAATASETMNSNAQSVDNKQLANAIDKVQAVTKTLANEVTFNIDQDSGQTVVKIVDSATNEVLRQMPSEEMLAIADALDKIQGLLIKQKA